MDLHVSSCHTQQKRRVSWFINNRDLSDIWYLLHQQRAIIQIITFFPDHLVPQTVETGSKWSGMVSYTVVKMEVVSLYMEQHFHIKFTLQSLNSTRKWSFPLNETGWTISSWGSNTIQFKNTTTTENHHDKPVLTHIFCQSKLPLKIAPSAFHNPPTR